MKPADHFYEESPFFTGTDPIPVSRYTSREFHELEKRYMAHHVADGLPRRAHSRGR